MTAQAHAQAPSLTTGDLAHPQGTNAGIFAFTLSWNEFIYALTFISSSEVKTVPVGVVTGVGGGLYLLALLHRRSVHHAP